MKFRAIKFFNILGYFRKHLNELGFAGDFYIQHPSHFSDHTGFREKVKLISYEKETKTFTVKKFAHKEGEKAYIKGVHRSQVYLNAK